MLGPLEVRAGGQRVTVGAAKQRVLQANPRSAIHTYLLHVPKEKESRPIPSACPTSSAAPRSWPASRPTRPALRAAPS
ncbi:hypothetical protein JOF53_003905 [Crossiella equi]|uniref:Uncharacterized protein n=1 Tax=Crossiella equi TaxID=130796 RepID=A0ABS5AEL0_9PSEU|nr:hypothetical protein [Crossiella equi]MBP2475033.1 hypothetical protein [Crossiella equi]